MKSSYDFVSIMFILFLQKRAICGIYRDTIKNLKKEKRKNAKGILARYLRKNSGRKGRGIYLKVYFR